MKRFTTFAIVLLLATVTIAQQETYSRIKINAGDEQLIQLAATGIDITEGTLKRGQFLVTELSGSEIGKVDGLGLDYEVLIEDVTKFYVDRNAGKPTDVSAYKGLSEWEVPENFTFGSMSGHATFEEAVDHLDNMFELFPDLITQKESIGQSIEGRDLWMVKISDNPTVNETEPEVLYTSLHHAREPAGLMTNLFFMYYLLENYDSDPFIQALVDNTELYFIPVINPDGYVYNQSISPNGGGMWRKNRRDNGVTGCMGVDLNRNYDYMWGLDNIGSSPDPCEPTYRGEEPFSEPESQAIRDFCESHELMNVMNYHTHGNLLLYPWGYTEEPCEDDATFLAHSVLYTADNNYTFGAGSTTIYPTNGGSDDWMYGEQTTKDKIYAYTPELGGGGDGFWCSIDRIIPIAQENMIMNILAAAFSGWYADVKVDPFPLVSETQAYLNYEISRLGLMDGATFTLTVEPLSDMIVSAPVEKTYSGMEILESIVDSVEYTLNVGTPSGTELQFLVSVENGQYTVKDTITRIFGVAEVLFEDNCNVLSNWISPTWNVTTSSYVSPTGSITDSPGGNYPNSHLGGVIMTETIDLSEAGFAMLDFNAKWEIEPGYDYVQLMISTNGGTTWEALEGKYTVTGTSAQAEGQPVYDGYQSEWVQELIDLTPFTGNEITFRFILKSDSWLNEDGFYFDDFRISTVEVSPVGIEAPGYHSGLVRVYPNPARDFVSFDYSNPLPGEEMVLEVFDATGAIVARNALEQASGTVRIGLSGLTPGIYFYRLENRNGQLDTGKLSIR